MEPSAQYKTDFESTLQTITDNHLEGWRRSNLYSSTNEEDAEARVIATYQFQACEQEQARRIAEKANA